MAKTATKRRSSTSPSAKSARGSGKSKSASAGKKLVIVESPAKAKTINRYLGSSFVVKASMGHVRDLPRKKIGVDIDHGFKPTYEPLTGRKKVLDELTRAAKSAASIYLATDLDREGEAIAWHLAESFGVPAEKIFRVVFNEITKSAITESFAHPRQIDLDKVNAQQARRILDRIVGYEISPLLWKKVSPGLSAGRVQSVAVRLIVEREREIAAFQPDEYWKISGIFTPDLAGVEQFAKAWAEFKGTTDERGNGPTRDQQQAFLAESSAFRAELVKWKGEKFSASDEDAALAVAKSCGLIVEKVDRSTNPKGKGPAANTVNITGHMPANAGPFSISRLAQRNSQSRPPAPFTTATMQQAASVQLRFSASRTMRTAQQLYEGIELPQEGSIGLITYMRTDSTHLASQAVQQVRAEIAEQFGSDYLPDKPRSFARGARAQEAHEAIRPTDVSRHPKDLRDVLEPAQLKLYELIWRRFVACQMAPAIWKVTEADIVVDTDSGQAQFRAIGRELAFKGYLAVAGKPLGGEQMLPELRQDMPVAAAELAPTQHFTQPPPRYTEASLVKSMEAEGIGRPSTYASIIKTIQDRGYVELISRAFHPTDLGTVVTDKLTAYFPKVMDVSFTAHMEDRLDSVEDHEAQWVDVLEDFYGPFNENLQRAREEMVHAKAEEQPSEYVCEQCGKEMVYRFAKNGRYLACTGYPDCKTTYPVDKEGKRIVPKLINVGCPICGKEMIRRTGRYGPFLSCASYPDCKGIVNLDKKGRIKLPSAPPLQVDLPCPKCGSDLYLRRSKRGPWLSCSKYPKCRGRQGWAALTDDQRKDLELKLLNHEKLNPQAVLKTLDGRIIEQGAEPEVIDEPNTQDSPNAEVNNPKS